MKELPDVRPGQVWADNDWRSKGREITVLKVTDRGGGPYALVEVTKEADSSVMRPAKKRQTLIAVRRFVPNSTGYRLIQDADAPH